MAGVTADLYETIERTVEGLGYELVDVERLAAGLLRVTLDAPHGVKLDDCERVSRQLSHLFAVEDVDYDRLEVSSPGLDRPLKRPRDFERFVGSEVQVELVAPVAVEGASAGRRRLRGRLVDVAGEAGRERARVELAPEAPAPGGPARRGARGKAGRRAGQEERVTAVVEFALTDVVKAKLVPQVDFRGAGRRGTGDAATPQGRKEGAGNDEP
jgi:ribosome maturation factor RimP